MTTNRNEYMQEYRDKNREKIREYNRNYNQIWRKKFGYYNEENTHKKYPEKVYARRLAQLAIKAGKIERKSCEVCGNMISQAHHDDYNKPLEVRWLCSLHHRQFHLTKDKKDV